MQPKDSSATKYTSPGSYPTLAQLITFDAVSIIFIVDLTVKSHKNGVTHKMKNKIERLLKV